MAPHLPVEDPYDRGLMDRSLSYVRSNPALRIAMWITALDHVALVALVIDGRRIHHPETAGVFALFSVLAWFFAVCMPVMNRTLRARLGAPETGYWSEVVEMFGCVVLCVQTALYTGVVAYAAAVGF